MKPLLAIAISGLLFTGCSKSVDPKTKSFVYPLAMGNQWTYAHLGTMDYVDARKTDPGGAYLNLPGGMYRSSSWEAPSLALPRQVPHATGIVCGAYWFPDVHTLVAALTDPASQTRGRRAGPAGGFP